MKVPGLFLTARPSLLKKSSAATGMNVLRLLNRGATKRKFYDDDFLLRSAQECRNSRPSDQSRGIPLNTRHRTDLGEVLQDSDIEIPKTTPATTTTTSEDYRQDVNLPLFNQLVLANVRLSLGKDGKRRTTILVDRSNIVEFVREVKENYGTARLCLEIVSENRKLKFDEKLDAFVQKQMKNILRDVAESIVQHNNDVIAIVEYFQKNVEEISLDKFDQSVPLPNDYASLSVYEKIISMVCFLRDLRSPLIPFTSDIDADKYLAALENIYTANR